MLPNNSNEAEKSTASADRPYTDTRRPSSTGRTSGRVGRGDTGRLGGHTVNVGAQDEGRTSTDRGGNVRSAGSHGDIFSSSLKNNPIYTVKKYNTPCVVVLAVMVLYLISERLLAGNYINSASPYVTVVIAQICVYLLPCAFFLAFSSLKGSISARDYGFSPIPLRLTGFCAASLFALVVGGMLIKYSSYLIFGTVSSAAVSVSASNDLLYVMLSSVFIPAITEEILFRGILYGAYEKKLGGVGAVLITSVLFAFIHFDTVNFVSYLYAGIVLGIAASATRSLLAPMILHLLNNLICIFSDTFLQRISKESISAVFVIFILGVIFLAVLFFYFEALEIYCREMAIARRKPSTDAPELFLHGEPRYVMLIRGFLAPGFLISAAVYLVRVFLF